MTRTGRWLAVGAVLLGLGAGGVMCQRVGERGRFAAAYSSYGAGPEGTRALYLLTRSLGVPPARWAQDMSGLPDDGMLVALGGCDNLMARQVGRYEREFLEQWVERGGVLLVAGAHDFLWSDIGVELSRSEGCIADVGLAGLIARAERGDVEEEPEAGEAGESEAANEDPLGLGQDPMGALEELAAAGDLAPAVWAEPTAGPLSGMEAVPIRRPATIVVAEGADASTLLHLPSGPAAVVVRRGEGAVIAVASANVFQNRELGASDGGVLFARLVATYAPAGPVIFDEFHLGVGERRGLIRYFRDVGGGAVAIQILLVIAFLLWRFTTRFGSPQKPAPPLPAGTASYVTAVGALFHKSADPTGAISLLVRHALSRVSTHYHFDTTDAAVMARNLDDRGRSRHAAAVRELGQIASAPRTDKRALVARARTIDACVARATSEAGEASSGGGAPATQGLLPRKTAPPERAASQQRDGDDLNVR